MGDFPCQRREGSCDGDGDGGDGGAGGGREGGGALYPGA